MTNPRKLQLAVLAAALAAALPAAAASVATGDLIMGFRATSGPGAGTTYVVSLGQASLYTSASGVITIGGTGSSIVRGNFGADLVAVYGADWATRTDLQWGIAGGTSGSNLFVSKAQANASTIPAPWDINTSAGRNTAYSNIQNIVGIDALGNNIVGGLDDSPITAHSAFASLEDSGYQNSWSSYMAGNGPVSDLGAFGGNGIEGTPGQSLSLFHIVDGNDSAYTGSFSISPNGTVTFSAVPEPGAMLLLGASALPVLFSRRRKNA